MQMGRAGISRFFFLHFHFFIHSFIHPASIMSLMKTFVCVQISNVPEQATMTQMQEVFNQFGKVYDIKLDVDAATGQWTSGSVLVEYMHHIDAYKAWQQLPNCVCWGRTLHVRPCEGSCGSSFKNIFPSGCVLDKVLEPLFLSRPRQVREVVMMFWNSSATLRSFQDAVYNCLMEVHLKVPENDPLYMVLETDAHRQEAFHVMTELVCGSKFIHTFQFKRDVVGPMHKEWEVVITFFPRAFEYTSATSAKPRS